MIRLLRSHDEVQAVVLNAIASMTSSRRKSRNSMFEPFLRYADESSLLRSVWEVYATKLCTKLKESKTSL